MKSISKKIFLKNLISRNYIVKKLREFIEFQEILVIVMIVTFFAVCGYGYSRLNFHSQTVSRLDLPTLAVPFPLKKSRRQ